MFSRLFSEVIPLHFLNVPYDGGRYPILSVYLFLRKRSNSGSLRRRYAARSKPRPEHIH
jgi:hypothetical protein